MIAVGPILVFLLLVAPGIRLLTLATRTREQPEFWGGLYFVGAAIGLPMRLVGSALYATQPEFANAVNTIGHISFAAGTIAMAIFTLHVFHRESSRARIFAALTIATIVVTSIHTLWGGFASIENSYSMVATNFARLVPTSWAFYESLRYYGSMRRRQTLGLADPIVTNRFLLWSIWTGAVTLLPLIALVLRTAGILSLGNDSYNTGLHAQIIASILTGVRILFLVIAPVAAIALSLSFFAPRIYIERIRSRDARTELA
jgi:hypothetical protein